MPDICNHQPRKVGKMVQKRINALKIGQKMQDLPEELWHDSFRYYVKEDPNRKGGPNLRMIRLDPSQPSLTVTGFIFNKFVHPYENRFITPREAARLQGFPDDLEFKGSLTSVQRQIGDAVPVPLGEAIFQSVLNQLDVVTDEMTLTSISLFSGAGGLDIASERAKSHQGKRFNTITSVELGKDRCDTLRGYFKNRLQVIETDISKLNTCDLLSKTEVKKEDVWMVYGGPPCQSFSQAGKQKGVADPRGGLIFEFLRIVGEILPRTFVLENVSNIKGIRKGQLLSDIISESNKLDYQVAYGILNSAEYGSPQKRKRFIAIGFRNDLNVYPKLPEPTHCDRKNLYGLPLFKTVGEALEGLPIPDYTPIEVD